MRELVRTLRGEGRATGVISISGDRRDEDMLALGRLAAQIFDEVIVREDGDRRGRAEGEIAALLRRGLLEGGLPEAALRVILSELEALETAMRGAAAGDLVVHFAEDVNEAWQHITGFQAEAAPAAAP